MDLNRQIQQLLEYFEQSNTEFRSLISPEKLKKEIDLELKDDPQNVENFLGQYLNFAVQTGHKDYANQLWSKVDAPSVLGEFLTAVTNTSMFTYEVAPVATLLEHSMIAYLSKLIWGESASGIMTSGGSSSNYQALLAARHHHFPQAKKKGLRSLDESPLILTASNAHYSIKRACNLLGFGEEQLIEVECDVRGRISSECLERAVKENPLAFIFISTAGTTVEGSFDNLSELGKICKKNNLWFHVDGAYGASVLLSQKHRELMNGIELCDSLSWDFHKMLGINLPCAFLFTKDKSILKSALAGGNEEYLFHDPDDDLDLGPKSLQCGRRADIVKLWVSWLSRGRKGFEERIEKLFATAQKLAVMIKADSKFELVMEPMSINVCFRPIEGSSRVVEIRNKLIEQADYMVNYSSDSEGPFFRMAITRPDLGENDLKEFLNKIGKHI